MATIKLQDGKVILKDGKASCECCAFFYGFDTSLNPRTKYKKMVLHDMDCCSICGTPPDGTITVTASTIDGGIVTSATGNYAESGCSPRIGFFYTKANFLVTDGASGTVFSDTKKNTSIVDPDCCNENGDAIWVELLEPIL
jgi:hypothetical protein